MLNMSKMKKKEKETFCYFVLILPNIAIKSTLKSYPVGKNTFRFFNCVNNSYILYQTKKILKKYKIESFYSTLIVKSRYPFLKSCL